MTRMDAHKIDDVTPVPPRQRLGMPVRIMLVSTPRSGNNWLRLLLARLYDVPSLSAHNPADVDWETLPNHCVLGIHWHPVPPFLALLERHGFRSVALARHPLDVLVSILHFALHAPTARWLESEGGNERSIYGAMPRSTAFLEYAAGPRATALLCVSREWWTLPGCLRVRYEDLVADPHTVLARLVDGLGVATCCSPDAALAATTIAKLRNLTGSPHHFWQGRPGLWKRLLPVPEAHALAKAQPAAFSALEYACDPDSNLRAGQADANWIELVGVDLVGEVQNLTALKQQLEASQQMAQSLQTQLAAAQHAFAEMQARLAATQHALQAVTNQWERGRMFVDRVKDIGPVARSVSPVRCVAWQTATRESRAWSSGFCGGTPTSFPSIRRTASNGDDGTRRPGVPLRGTENLGPEGTLLAQTRDVPQQVAHRDDTNRQAILQHRQMAIATHVHFVQGEGERIAGGHGFGVGGHELVNGQFGIGIIDASHLRQQVALTEDTQQFSIFAHDEQSADVAVEHHLHGVMHRGGRRHRFRRSRLEHADRILHEAPFDVCMRDRPIELGKIHQAVATLFTAGQIIMTAVGANHEWSPES